jgi:drug/metabolite transporter (DMT)-like permease
MTSKAIAIRMSWLVFAFSGPVLWAISVHLDKYLVERFFKDSNVAVLLLFTAWIGILLLPFIWLYEPDLTAPGAAGIAVIMASGVLYMGAMLLYLRALQTEEASVVAPFFQASPLFGYGLAYLVLGETLSGRQMIGGVLIIAGALIVSLKLGASGNNPAAGRFKARLALLMLACGFALAVATLIFKIFAIRAEFWTTTFWLFVGEAVFGAGLLSVRAYRAQFFTLLRTNTAALLSINGANELINLGGGLGSRYALLFAPLSIVQAIGSTTTLFVFMFGVLLSVASPRLGRESLSGRELAQKGVAAVLVAAGVALVTR